MNLPFLPHRFHRIRVQTRQAVRHERLEGASTYFYQLQAFAAAIYNGEPAITDADDALGNMRVIDAFYQAAGLRPRNTP